MEPNETISLSPKGAAELPDTDKKKKKYNFMRNVLERLAVDGLDERSVKNHVTDFVTGEYTGRYKGESDKKYEERRGVKNVEDPTLFQHVLAGHLSETPIDGSWVYPGYNDFKTKAGEIGSYNGANRTTRGSPVETNRLKRQLADSEPDRETFAAGLKTSLQRMFSAALSNMSLGTPTETITINKTRVEGKRRQYSVVIPSGMLGSRRDMILSVERNKGEQAFRTFSFQPGPLLPRRY